MVRSNLRFGYEQTDRAALSNTFSQNQYILRVPEQTVSGFLIIESILSINTYKYNIQATY